jgi:hypothetical protein
MTKYDQIIKNLNRALKESHLYSDEELHFMRQQLRTLRESKLEFLQEDKNGFGS